MISHLCQKPFQAAPKKNQTGLVEQLSEVAPELRRETILKLVSDKVSRLFGASQEWDYSTSLKEQGLDSLMAVELRNSLGEALGRKLPMSLIFSFPTINDLVDHLNHDLFKAEPVKTGSPSPVEKSIDVDLDELSSEQLEQLIYEDIKDEL
jgi:acyl carrier protein